MSNEPETQIDVDAQVEAVDRDLTLDLPRTVATISQVFPTTVDDLWEAVTSAERLPRWFAPVSGELELGGHYQVEGNAGGTIKTCVPPESFSATWEFGGASSDIEVTVAAEADGARLTLVHSAVGPQDYDKPDSFWKTYGPGATGVGWELGLLGLFQYLSTGISMPAEASEWGTSEEAKRFITACSERWGDASIAAGTPPEEARAAQERTTAFYTGA